MINSKQEILDRNIAVTTNLDINDGSKESIISLRQEIICLYRDVIDYYSKNGLFDLWRKDCLAYGLSCLSWNFGEKNSYDDTMLVLCLIEIEKSTVDEDERSPSYPHNVKRAEVISKLTDGAFYERINQLESCNK
jgi:hypothetical protein